MVQDAINLLCHLPVGKLHSALALIVLLRSAEGCERELVCIVKTLRDVDEVGIALEVGALCIAVAPCLRSEQGHSPTRLRETCRHCEHHLVHIVVANAVVERATLLGLKRLCDDVDGTAHRRSRHLRGAQSALCLHGACNVGKASPVRPVNVLVLHIVHRNTIHHHGNVGVVESTHVNLRVAIATALFVGVYARGRLKNFRELLSTNLLLDKRHRHLRHSHRCLACHSHLRCYNHVLQHLSVGCHNDVAKLAVAANLNSLLLVADVLHQDLLGSAYTLYSESTVNVGNNLDILHRHSSADKRLAGLCINNLTSKHRLCHCGCCARHSERTHNEEMF